MPPLAEAIASYVRAGQAIHADDTPVDVLSPGRGKTLTGRLRTYVRDERLWGSSAPPAAVFAFSMDRKGIRPAQHLAGYKGFMHADGYAGFEEPFRTGGIREVACLAHVSPSSTPSRTRPAASRRTSAPGYARRRRGRCSTHWGWS